MPSLTIATFNCENLFLRYKFNSKSDAAKAVENGFIIDVKKFDAVLEEERKLTAAAIKEMNPDILALQEVESMDSLKAFNARFLGGAYKYKAMIDGNDPRLIDVAILSKVPFDHVQTHQFRRSGSSYIFSRDCLEVTFTVGGKPLGFFVNHFKSMIEGRDESMPRRTLQAKEVVKILKEKYGNDPSKHDWVMLGDLNDYQPSTAIEALVKTGWMENVVERLPEEEQWTHAYRNDLRQLDYLFLSSSLAKRNTSVKPVIVRKGLSLNVKNYTGPRFPGVGKDRPHASDHCPVGIKINI
ncbi:MAG: endonuclease/exonuclease/phosphatase [Bacteroidetes bacterium]|nr:MAG: endonuclease/exonuclease/phosphatase [Bacteroidota bacterium]